MLKKTITYEDYNGETRTEDFYFNLSKAELIKLYLQTEGGLDAFINKLVTTRDIPALTKLFDDFVRNSYGEKSLDGKRFIKSEEATTAFMQTEAYSELLVELLSGDGTAAAEFINGVIPQKLADEVRKEQASGKLPQNLSDINAVSQAIQDHHAKNRNS